MQLNVTQIVPNLPDDVAPENATLARLRTHICNVTGGIVEYKVQLLSSDSVSLLGGRSDDRFLEDLVLPGPGTFGADSTIGGFAYAASYLFASEAVLNFAGAVSGFTFTGSLANQQVQSVNLSNITFGDPMDYMLDTMREIAFRTSVRAGKDQDSYNVTNAEQKVAYTGTATRSVYVTDFGYMAGAAAVSILSVLAVGLTFYGWWELGNNVSLSPLDIARAFDAPLLKLESPGLVGMQRVQYGKEISGEEDAQAKEIGGQYSETGRRRLVMGLTGTVKRPSAGEVVVL
ncbi:hypothetical protein P153DRAFT_287946 [Dothidotthia symphoricarpi CBS 119687]|uniref:Uncharacterized protein n=1 Tax=Dothidotthia symphoricarpi CBS 119687 TaxID=1392245 RepID=A0A6A6AI25_9PLEO|nr:uncharacterized protein P153DRAFT_287946 [Dothidotthia symphoricarpi CBS 119687]KAF2130903.1 hypothetical protein P153DRAFT_287946 [Dothidotthia symphoricarpi CBS 119687]